MDKSSRNRNFVCSINFPITVEKSILEEEKLVDMLAQNALNQDCQAIPLGLIQLKLAW